jgi:hypothetical protein
VKEGKKIVDNDEVREMERGILFFFGAKEENVFCAEIRA